MGRKSRIRSERRESAAVGPAGRRPAPGAIGARTAVSNSVIAGLVLLTVLVTVWAAPRLMPDTFMGLAGGRDVFDGKLGKPDDWSFMNAGRIWLHQNWGFDALMYAAFRAGGDAGLLAFKALMILAIAGASLAAARARGSGWTSALLVTAAALAGARLDFELRANLGTYLMLCLMLLVVYGSARRPCLIWVSVPLIAAWSNLHGGFTVGLALLGLWIAAGAVEQLRREGIRAALRWAWQPAAAAVASAAAVAVFNPYGPANLTHPFTVLGSSEWRKIQEWRPASFETPGASASLWALTILAGTVVVIALWRGPGKKGQDHGNAGPPSVVLFDTAVFVLLVAMAASAVRFLPVALIGLAPLAAAQVEFALAHVRSWVPSAAAIALALSLVPFASRTLARYSRDNPRFPHHDAFERMVSAEVMPMGAAAFLADNGADGRALVEWSWEGVIHWLDPRPKLLIGGRAQQVYSLETLHTYDEITRSPQPDRILASLAVHLVVVPFEGRWLDLIDKLAFARGSQWTTVFFDGRALVLADPREPEMRGLVEGVASGGASFRDPAVASLSRAMCRISPATGGLTPESARELLTANRSVPAEGTPWALALAATGQRSRLDWFVGVLEAEDAYLAGRAAPPALRLRTLESRVGFAKVLAALYKSSGQAAKASRSGATAEELRSEVVAVIERT